MVVWCTQNVRRDGSSFTDTSHGTTKQCCNYSTSMDIQNSASVSFRITCDKRALSLSRTENNGKTINNSKRFKTVTAWMSTQSRLRTQLHWHSWSAVCRSSSTSSWSSLYRRALSSSLGTWSPCCSRRRCWRRSWCRRRSLGSSLPWGMCSGSDVLCSFLAQKAAPTCKDTMEENRNELTFSLGSVAMPWFCPFPPTALGLLPVIWVWVVLSLFVFFFTIFEWYL